MSDDPCATAAACCRERPEGGLDGPCTWPETDCYQNGPAMPTTTEEDEPVNPRWIDHHWPDYCLIMRLGHLRRMVRRTRLGGIDRALARYCLRHVHCGRDGQCVLRAGHRGGCTWGDDGD